MLASVVIDKGCRFVADASKITSAACTFSIGNGGSNEQPLVLRAEESDYKKWVTDIGRAKMTTSGFSTASSRSFQSLFGRGNAGKLNLSGSPSSAAASSNVTALPSPGTGSKSAAVAAAAVAGLQPSAKEFAAKVADIVRLEEQLARKRQEAMNLLQLMESSGEQSSAMSPLTSTIRKATLNGSGGTVPVRLDAYRHALHQDSQKRLVATTDWTASTSFPGDLSLTAGDAIHPWYTSSSVAWGFGAVSREGKEISGWFPLFATKAMDDADMIRSRAASAPALPGVPGAGVAEVKKLDLEGFAVKVFNMKAKKGVQWIKEQLAKSGSVLSDAEADVQIGHFLWDHRRSLSKDELGDLFGEERDEAKRIYDAFVSKFIVAGLDLDLALRRLLYLFKLPGEAQKIDRIMQVFSRHYYTSNCGPDSTLPLVRDALKSPKEAYTLVFALIMLNTDAHTESLPKHMTCQEFLDNIRFSTKEGIFIDNDYLTDMYWRIVNEEIKMQDAARYPFASKKGFLDLRIGPFWAKRWIVLTEGKLVICKSVSHEDEAQLVAPAASLVVEDLTSEGASTLGFAVSTPVTKLKFRAKSERDRLQWLAAFAKERDVVVEEDAAAAAGGSATAREGSDGSDSARSELFSTPATPGAKRFSSDLAGVRRPLILPAEPLEDAATESIGSGAASVVVPPIDIGATATSPSSSRDHSKSPRPGGKSPRRRKKKTMTGTKKRRKRAKVVAMYDVEAPPGSGRISVSAGEVLLLIQRTNSVWHKVQSHAGVSGFIPVSYITPHISGISSLEPPPQPSMPPEDFTRESVPLSFSQDQQVFSSLLSPRPAADGNEDEDEEEEKTEN